MLLLIRLCGLDFSIATWLLREVSSSKPQASKKLSANKEVATANNFLLVLFVLASILVFAEFDVSIKHLG